MRVTDVRIRKLLEQGNVRAIVSVTLNNQFAVHDIKIIEGVYGIFVAMPSRRMPDGEFADIAHPINIETRKKVQEAILEEYKKALITV